MSVARTRIAIVLIFQFMRRLLRISHLLRLGTATAAMEASGVRVVPYTTGRLFDPLIPDWTKDHAARYECVGVNGAPFLAKFEPSYNWSQHTMNMAQEYWQDKISDLAIYLHEHATFSGIYSDAVTGNAEACADPTTADGGLPSKYVAGAAWSNGIRTMWQKMRAKAGPGKMIMSESNTEAYVGVLDAQLAIYGFRSCGKVPAFQSVYADHTVMVGALGMDVLMGQVSGKFAAGGEWSPGSPSDLQRDAYRALLVSIRRVRFMPLAHLTGSYTA